jgi:acyl-CoA reductase-like NAD-dependent aldehyde dehydrogenase
MSSTTTQFRNLVAGELVESVDARTRDVLKAATGKVVATVREGGAADVERAVAAAADAHVAFRDTTPGHWRELLLEGR